MKERRGRDIFRQKRVDARLLMLSNAKDKEVQPTTEELDEAARKAEQQAIEKVGSWSENKFVKFASNYPIIKSVVNPNPLLDVYDGVDKWVVLIDGFHLPALPVQIKSSTKDVNLFKYGDVDQNRRPHYSFKKLHGLMVVVNCGPSCNYNLFDEQIRKEVGRITNILASTPYHIKGLLDLTPNRLKTNYT